MTPCPCASWWRPSDRSRLVFSTGARYSLDQVDPGCLRRWWWRLRRRTVALFTYKYLPPECPAGYYAPHQAARGPLRAKPWARICGRCARGIKARERWTHEGAVAVHRALPAGTGARVRWARTGPRRSSYGSPTGPAPAQIWRSGRPLQTLPSRPSAPRSSRSAPRAWSTMFAQEGNPV